MTTNYALATIQPWGNSQGLRIPKSTLQSVGFAVSDRVELVPAENELVIRKATPQKRHRTLRERLEEFYGLPFDEIQRSASEPEIDWGPPVGEEIW